MVDIQMHVLEARDGIPNSALPLVLVRGGLPGSARQGEAACALFAKNGWAGNWVYTVYPFWHFHTLGHEVLGCVSGRARLGFGGDGGLETVVEPGDVCIIPAGVGHRRIEASADFLVAEGYPPDQRGNIVRPGEIGQDLVEREIASVALPETDPISGKRSGVPGWPTG